MTNDPMVEEILEELWIATEEEGKELVSPERLGLGAYCKEGRTSARSVVVPLSELKKGERGTVAYLQAGEEDETIPKLLALGVLPGCKVELLQRYPSYLFRIGHTQMAVDDTIAGSVRIRVGA